MGYHQYSPGCYVGIHDNLVSEKPIITKKCLDYRETCWTENYQDEPVVIWNRWVVTNVHLDQSSPLRKKWYQFHWAHGEKGKVFFESKSWWDVCLVGEIVLFGLWKAFMNLFLAGLNLFHKPIVSWLDGAFCRHHCRWRSNIFFLFCNLLLLDSRCWGCSGCSNLMCILWTYCEGDEFCSMRYYLVALFWWNNSHNSLWYLV